MPARFTVDARPDRDRLVIALGGFFEQTDLARFDYARRMAHGLLRCGPNQHDSLIDLTAMSIQSAAIFEAFRAIVADPQTRARRLAIVTGTGAVRLQVRRLVASDPAMHPRPAARTAEIHCFETMVAAEAWLDQPAGGRALAG